MGEGCEAIGEVPFDLVSFFILALLVHHCGLSEWDSHYSCLNYLMQFLLVALDSPISYTHTLLSIISTCHSWQTVALS